MVGDWQEAQTAVLLADVLQRLKIPEDGRPYTDVIDEIPVNPNPTAPKAWWMRTPEQITGITIHHNSSYIES